MTGNLNFPEEKKCENVCVPVISGIKSTVKYTNRTENAQAERIVC